MPRIHTDTLTRRLYANDASMYEEMPQGVVYPESARDMVQLVEKAGSESFPIIPRGGGTSLAGQATGNGVVMDVSRFMDKIQDIDPDERIASVQPGVIRDSLNRALERHKLQFGPDTSTTDRCMVGGMIGNNSCGLYSIRYGTTREHVKEIQAVLSDGSVAVFKPLTPSELDAKCKMTNLEGRIYRGMLSLLKENREKILEAYPHPEIIRRNTGYALDRLCEMKPITPGGRPFNLAELLCGSEGTLALTASAKLNLVPVEPYNILVIPQFNDLQEAMKATVETVKFEPAAVELVDDIILQATKGNIEQKKNRFFLEGEPECLLIIQFNGDDPKELEEHAGQLIRQLRKKKLGYTWPVIANREQIQRVWNLRKAGLGLLMGLGKDARSPTFVEDTAVRVEDLPAYVRDFQKMMEKYETNCVFYAHASVGELHLRPVLDITTQEGIDKMKAMAEEVAGLVAKYNGSLSGEHGDGRARAPYIEKVLGPEMMPLLRHVKELWDQNYRFNPGKILKPKPIDTDLRFAPGYQAPDPETVFKWRKEDGFGHALEQCNGAGVCRKRAESGGTMCPSYHATLDEKDTTRGRANLFRQIFINRRHEAFSSGEIREGLELCLSCKACKSECPANVDMAKMKAEFMHGWHKEQGKTMADRFFGEPERMYPMASMFPRLSNLVTGNKAVRYLMQVLAGVDARRTLPRFGRQTFRSWFRSNRSIFQKGDRPKVALLVDVFSNYHEPEIAFAACRVLHRLGYEVIVPDVIATGRPQISRGLLDRAKEICDANLRALEPLAGMDVPVVGLEPSEILTLRDEYLDLCEDEQLQPAQTVAENSWLFEEFVAGHLEKQPDDSQLFHTGGAEVALHGHCHTKALVGNEPLINMLKYCGFRTTDLQTGCCGMAGSFGYEYGHYEVSMKIGEQLLFPAIRRLDRNAEICAPGFSCRHQIADGVGKEALHPAQLLEKYLSTG